ncbi:hypothetical protein DVH24_009237 [Malus domestica]|uniref:Protein kinase domain-containing protein n=1 Tax=Malus domestica TaxID=3750 RepID=A0A498IPC2_MALDO|nr:hypothetical protein DVH24_009237 [Malus domestica]
MASKSKIYFAMDLVCGGELFPKAFSAIDFCHDSGVYHRDLKTSPRSKPSITIMAMFNTSWNLPEGLWIWIAIINDYGSERVGEGDDYGSERGEG